MNSTKEVKNINIKVSIDFHKRLKMLSMVEETSIQNIVVEAIKEYFKKIDTNKLTSRVCKNIENIFSEKKEEKSKREKLIIDGEEFVIEPTTEEDIPVLERGREEIARGEYIEITDEEELDSEDNNN